MKLVPGLLVLISWLLSSAPSQASSIYPRDSYDQGRRITVTQEKDAQGQPTAIYVITYEKVKEDKTTHTDIVKSSEVLGRISKQDLQAWVDFESRKNAQLAKNAPAQPDAESAAVAIGYAQQYGLGAQVGLNYLLQSAFAPARPKYDETAYILKFAGEFNSTDPAYSKTYPDPDVYFSDFKSQVIKILKSPVPMAPQSTPIEAISESSQKFKITSVPATDPTSPTSAAPASAAGQ